MIRTACLAAVAALLLTVPSTASAYWGYGFGGYPWGYGPAYTQSTGYVPPPPYFAVYPPVYYSSHITARHYGASPYAWLPGMSPITYLPRRVPVMITNPRAAGAKPVDEPQKVATTREIKPLMVLNPFVQGTAPAAVSKTPQPLRIDNVHVARAGQ